MSIVLPLSTNILFTLLLATLAAMTNASLCGWCTHLEYAFVKITSSSSRQALFTRHSSVLCTCVKGALRASFAYLSCAFQFSPTTFGPPKMVKTSLILYGLRCLGRSFVTVTWGSFSKNSLKCPAHSNLSILSLRGLHFTMLCPISL